MVKCKKCNVEKERNYLCLDARQRSVFKDEFGKIWHGRVCSDCFTAYVKTTSGKTPLKHISCAQCGSTVKQKHSFQKYCSKKCYATWLSNSNRLPDEYEDYINGN